MTSSPNVPSRYDLLRPVVWTVIALAVSALLFTAGARFTSFLMISFSFVAAGIAIGPLTGFIGTCSAVYLTCFLHRKDPKLRVPKLVEVYKLFYLGLPLRLTQGKGPLKPPP